VIVNSTVESSATGSGALIVYGGVGVAKHVNIGGNLNVQGDITILGASTNISTVNLLITDNLLVINSAPKGGADGGVMINRFVSGTSGSTNYASIFFKDNEDKFVFGFTDSNPTENNIVISDYAPVCASGIEILGTENSIGVGTGGSVTILGGAAISKDLYIGGSLYVDEDLVVSGLVSMSSLSISNLTLQNLVTTNTSFQNSIITNSTNNNSIFVNISSSTLNAINMINTNTTITNLISNNSTINNLSVTNLTCNKLLFTDSTGINLVVTNLTAGNIVRAEYYYTDSTAAQSTTNTVYQTFYNHTTGSLIGGKYKIDINYSGEVLSTTVFGPTAYETRLLLNGNTIHILQNSPRRTADIIVHSAYSVVTLSSGPQTILFQYRQSGGTTARISLFKIIFTRIDN